MEAQSKNRFYPLKVKDIRRETNEAISISFQLQPEEEELFKFIPGQYVTLRLNVNGEELRRSYSICSAPYENELRVAVKKVENGKASTYLNQNLAEGDVLDVMPPMGNFYRQTSANATKKYTAFAAGSGITPIISILKDTLRAELQSRFTLIYANQNEDTIIFNDELNSIKNEYGDRMELIHVLSRAENGDNLLEGRIDEQKFADLANAYSSIRDCDAYFLCGPEALIQLLSKQLLQNGIDEAQIHYELFTSSTNDEENSNAEEITEEETSTSSMSKVSIKLDGNDTDLGLKKDGQTILEAAISQGIDPPYSCKSAICVTCMAKLISGKVKMDVNHALSDDDIAEGLILTCQSHPTTDEVSISYDDV